MKGIKSYFSDSLNEMKKVVWPSRNDLLYLTISVVVVSSVFTALIWLFDFAFNTGYKYLLSL